MLNSVSLTAAIVPRTGTNAVSKGAPLPVAFAVAPAREAIESLGVFCRELQAAMARNEAVAPMKTRALRIDIIGFSGWRVRRRFPAFPRSRDRWSASRGARANEHYGAGQRRSVRILDS